MVRGRNWIVALVAMALWAPAQAFAQVTPLDPWTRVSSTAPGVPTINTAPVNVTVTVGAVPVPLLSDGFARTNDPGTLAPWLVQSGNWLVSGGTLRVGRESGIHSHSQAPAWERSICHFFVRSYGS